MKTIVWWSPRPPFMSPNLNAQMISRMFAQGRGCMVERRGAIIIKKENGDNSKVQRKGMKV